MPGFPFKTLRKITQTVAGAAQDPEAIDVCMGHVTSLVKKSYTITLRQRERRLKAVANEIHQWLFDEPCVWSAKSTKLVMPESAK